MLVAPPVVRDPHRGVLVGHRLVGFLRQVDNPEPAMTEQAGGMPETKLDHPAGIWPAVGESAERTLQPGLNVPPLGAYDPEDPAHSGSPLRIEPSRSPTLSRKTGYENRPADTRMPAAPMHRARLGSSRRLETASATSSVSKGSTSSPVSPSTIASGAPPARPATTGKPN